MNKLFDTPRGAAFLSVVSNTVLVISKTVIGLMTGSVAVLSEGIHSGLDLIAAVITFFSVSMSARPPDGGHPYGHGKIENVSGTVEALLIIIAGGYIIYEAVHRLKSGAHVSNINLGLGVMVVSAVVNIFESRKLFRVAKKHESPALEADAHHLSTDVYTSLGVVAGLALVRFTGLHWLDGAVALGVAVFIIFIGLRVLKSSFSDLLDQKLPEKEERIIREVIELHVGEFISYHRLRTRKSGAVRYIELHLVVREDQSVKKAHDFCSHIEEEIRCEIRNANITIHIEPFSR